MFCTSQLPAFTHVTNQNDPVTVVPPQFLSFEHPQGEAHITAVDATSGTATIEQCPGQENDVSNSPPSSASSSLTRYPRSIARRATRSWMYLSLTISALTSTASPSAARRAPLQAENMLIDVHGPGRSVFAFEEAVYSFLFGIMGEKNKEWCMFERYILSACDLECHLCECKYAGGRHCAKSLFQPAFRHHAAQLAYTKCYNQF